MTLKELMAARKAKADAMRALIASAGENGMNAEQQAEFDKLEAEAKQLLKTIESAQAVEALHASTGRQTEPGSAAPMRIEGGTDRATQDPWAGFSGPGEFYGAIRRQSFGQHDQRLDALRSAVGATGHGENSQDGYLAPPQLAGDLFSAVDEFADEDLYRLCDVEPSAASHVEFDRDEGLTWTSGEITAKWRDEGGSMTPQRTKPPQKATLKPESMYVFVKSSDELLADAPRMFNRLTKKSAAAIIYKRNTALLEGTGVGQPIGVFSSSNGALITVAKESGQAADTIVKANIDKMYNNLLPRSKGRARWMCGPGVLMALEGIYQANSNLFMPAGGLQDTPLARLRGMAAMESEYIPQLGDANDISLIDFSGIKVVERQGIQYATSIHIYFDTAEQAFRWTLRWNAMPKLSAPLTRNKGSSAYNLSHFVTLAERA